MTLYELKELVDYIMNDSPENSDLAFHDDSLGFPSDIVNIEISKQDYLGHQYLTIHLIGE